MKCDCPCAVQHIIHRGKSLSFHPLQLLCVTGANSELPCRCHMLSVGAGNGSVCPYLPGRLPLSYLEVMEKKATFLMFKEIGNWSGRLPRQGCLQTKKHGENGNALKGGGKKGGNGSIWDWMEKESLGLSHINGLPPKPFLLLAATAVPASPGADNSHAEGLKLGTFIRDPLAWLRPRRERVRMSLGLAVSHPRGTKKLEEVSTLKTSPGA